MTIHLHLNAVLALAVGILVLAFPKLFRYIVGIYFVAIGILGIIR
jgi:hypothetical protein